MRPYVWQGIPRGNTVGGTSSHGSRRRRALSSNARWSIILVVFVLVPLVAAYAFAFVAGVEHCQWTIHVCFTQEHENDTLHAIADVLVVLAEVSLAVGVRQQARR